MNQSHLVYDGRLVIDNDFHTNDSCIRAAGKMTTAGGMSTAGGMTTEGCAGVGCKARACSCVMASPC